MSIRSDLRFIACVLTVDYYSIYLSLWFYSSLSLSLSFLLSSVHLSVSLLTYIREHCLQNEYERPRCWCKGEPRICSTLLLRMLMLLVADINISLPTYRYKHAFALARVIHTSSRTLSTFDRMHRHLRSLSRVVKYISLVITILLNLFSFIAWMFFLNKAQMSWRIQKWLAIRENAECANENRNSTVDP